MNKQTKGIFLILIIVIALIITSCDSQSPGMDETAFLAAVDTAVAATDSAQAAEGQLTQDAKAAYTHTATSAPPATTTAIPDTATPQLAPSNTPTLAEILTMDETLETPEFTLRGPAVQVSVDTNCRSGPGVDYSYQGALLVGDEASIFGTDPSGGWYYIDNPSEEKGYCWIWNHYAQTSGSISPLPVFTPGPTSVPEPRFSVGFREVESCGGAWQVEFEIVNTGVYTLESVSTFVQDTVTNAKTGSSSMNGFEKKTGCTLNQKPENRGPGESGFTVSLDLSNNPTGHLTYASVTVCTLDNLVGKCNTREFYFTP